MSNKSIFMKFVKSMIPEITVFFTVIILLLAFFNLFYGRSEIIYPSLVSGTVFLLYGIYKWVKFREFFTQLPMTIKNPGYDPGASGPEQIMVRNVINEIHKSYLNQLSEIKASDKEFRRFLSQFIHSVKTPVTVIDLAVQGAGGKSRDEVLEDISLENRRIYGMLENVLSLLRLDEFEADYSLAPVNLEKALSTLINGMRKNFVYSNVFPRMMVECTDPVVLTDDKWNSLLVEQILSNAIKYSSGSDIARTVFIRIAKNQDKVVLSIKDEGMGIPKSDLPRVKEAFFTGENGRKVRNSSGIGLYVASRIAGKLDHTFEISSEVNKGTEVKITYLSKL